MTQDISPITAHGYKQLCQELDNLKTKERKLIADDIAAARSYGDLSENAEYKAAMENQTMLESKIARLEHTLSTVQIINPVYTNKDTIQFGAKVDIVDVDDVSEVPRVISYIIVGDYEADINKSQISILSPIARALIHKKVGDVIDVVTPKKTRSYEIVAIHYNQIHTE